MTTSASASISVSVRSAMLSLANFNLFVNKSDQVKYFKAKDDSVRADFSGFDQAKGYDCKAINTTSKTGLPYIRLALILGSKDDKGVWVRGSLFPEANKKSENAPDFTGTIGDEKDGTLLRIAAWNKKGEKAGDYLSIAISEPRPAADGAPAASNEGAAEQAAPEQAPTDDFPQ